jgi:hypothetical protein
MATACPAQRSVEATPPYEEIMLLTTQHTDRYNKSVAERSARSSTQPRVHHLDKRFSLGMRRVRAEVQPPHNVPNPARSKDIRPYFL